MIVKPLKKKSKDSSQYTICTFRLTDRVLTRFVKLKKKETLFLLEKEKNKQFSKPVFKGDDL